MTSVEQIVDPVSVLDRSITDSIGFSFPILCVILLCCHRSIRDELLYRLHHHNFLRLGLLLLKLTTGSLQPLAEKGNWVVFDAASFREFVKSGDKKPLCPLAVTLINILRGRTNFEVLAGFDFFY